MQHVRPVRPERAGGGRGVAEGGGERPSRAGGRRLRESAQRGGVQRDRGAGGEGEERVR